MTEILNSTKIIQLELDLRPLRARMDGDVVGPGDARLGRRASGLEPRGRSASRRGRCPRVRRGRRGRRRVRPHRRASRCTAGHRPQRPDAGRPLGHDPAQDPPDARRHDRPGHPHRARRGRRDLDRGRRSCGRARPRSARRLIAGRRRRRLHARRRPLLARAQARHRRQPGDGDRGRHGRRASSCARTGRTSPTCSGRCGAAAAAFAIVTAIEFNLFPISEVYAGILWYPVEEAAEVLKAWRSWTEDLPDEMTSVGRILQFPPIPEIPEPVRGKSFVVVEAIWLGEPAEGDRLLEPLRALGPVMDTMAEMPIEGLSHLHMDPEEPVPGAGDGGMLNEVDDELDRSLRAAHRRCPDPQRGDPPPWRSRGTAIVSARGDQLLRRALHHVRRRSGPDAGAGGGRRDGRRRPAGGARALGGRPHVHELRRDQS